LNELLNWSHDRSHVRLLQHAHADHIESMYRGLLRIQDNPAGVIIQQIGPTRTFIASGNRLENRAIFSGEETPGEIDAVLHHFIAHQSNLVIEVNPANFYVNPPVTWEKRLLAHLLKRGCVIHDFRCVWCCTKPPDSEDLPTHRIERFTSSHLDDYCKLAAKVDPSFQDSLEFRFAHADPGWSHYVAFHQEIPAATGTLFIKNTIGYLTFWRTHPNFRGHGLQQAGIGRRMKDSFDAGCQHVFTVTDFNFTSPRNLQRCGFHLAYNYLLLRRDPIPLQ
jgi:hypothetical protein